MTRNVQGKHIRAITDEEVEEMGWKPFAIIARGIERLDIERALMALVPPPLLGKDRMCRNHLECCSSFIDGWMTVMFPKLIGVNAKSMADILDNMTNILYEFPLPFDVGCRMLVTRTLKDPQGLFKAEEEVIKAVTEKIQEFYRLNKI